MSGYAYSMYSGDTGFREIEQIGIPSQADENDLEKGLTDIMNIIKYEQVKQKKHRRHRPKTDDFLDVDEFDE